MRDRFDSIAAHGFVRAAVCIPALKVADPAFNVARTIALAEDASRTGAGVVLFPELGLSAYSNDDLFQQEALLAASEEAVAGLVAASRSIAPVVIAGAPLRFEAKLFNCAVVCHRGRLLGVVPKTYLPNYREFYEKRQFASGRSAVAAEVRVGGHTAPFGSDLLFEATDLPGFVLHVEICEDLWTPVPPSTGAAMAGATVLANLSASNITIGKADWRRTLCASQSGRCIAAYLFAASGAGESTTDLAWDGHAMIWENGELLVEAERFADPGQTIVADVDLDRLAQDRMRMTSFVDASDAWLETSRAVRRVGFAMGESHATAPLRRDVPRFPFVPADPRMRDQRCYEAYNIQVHGLMKRLASTGIERVVIGVSGGLDSTQALLVAAKTMDRMGLPRKNILAYTLPGFATSDLTLGNARELMEAMGTTAAEIDIRPACMQTFRDIGHPYAQGDEVYDLTFENVQAGERTSVLFRLANRHGGLVLGTSDLSELALGWTTYGVGDQMSHYNVNGSVPKTLIQHLVRWAVLSHQFEEKTAAILRSIVETDISPELVPSGNGDSGRPAQRSADVVGPYELQDFNLYYVTRFGHRPSKVAFLAHEAWGDRDRGSWPDTIPEDKRRAHDLAEIKRWLAVFLLRFFKLSQFKRSALPNGPKVGSGGSLSPRSDWRAPSDAEAEVWLRELEDNVPE